MDVHPAHAAASEVVSVDELEGLVVAGGLCPRHFLEKTEHLGAPLQPAERQLTHDERVDENEPALQKGREPRVAFAQMIDPDRCVDENQRGVLPEGRARRRGARRRSLSEPPSAASLRALSRAIKASRPAWTIAVFSFRPVRLRALSRRSSSRISVVLICISMAV